MATIKAAEGFRAEVDAEALQDALHALKDEYQKGVSMLINLGTSRSAHQRYSIVDVHQKVYGTFAPDEIKKKVKGWTGHGLWALYMPAAKRDATWLHEAMVGLGTDEATIAEIVCTRTSAQLKVISEGYKQLYNKDLVGDIEGETSGYLRKLLAALLTVTRETGNANRERASALAQELYDAGEGKWGTDESKFIDILTRESAPMLREVFSSYLTKFHKSIIDIIKAEFGGHLQATLIVLVRGILDPTHYFADRISQAVEGLGTDEAALIRCIIARADIDLERIKTAFAAKYKKELAIRVNEDIGGDFQELFHAVIR
ncbi:hypothetical protein CBR_g29795 [Chara braunii]|uniref:Annexin n=1 Tax=Chara braunii TaxID=69332 RepID=A0A388LBH8_CHABU|nr:hypothetical protein CBR_g29795 [Chara braunii]|eukprot:GBG79646.1 hypothetical protein CBR_g29795 [Chara braunii]